MESRWTCKTSIVSLGLIVYAKCFFSIASFANEKSQQLGVFLITTEVKCTRCNNLSVYIGHVDLPLLQQSEKSIATDVLKAIKRTTSKLM